MWTAYGLTMGHGPHWASTPAIPAPRPNPAVWHSAARRAASPPSVPLDSSFTQLLPTDMAMPTAKPVISRPA